MRVISVESVKKKRKKKKKTSQLLGSRGKNDGGRTWKIDVNDKESHSDFHTCTTGKRVLCIF